MAIETPTIRGILAPLAEDSLLLPSNVVAEVIEFAKPMPYESGPRWLLGELEWHGWQVPIISYALLSGTAQRDPASSSSRILVIKTLTDDVSLYYIGILMKGLPKLKKLSPDSIEPQQEKVDSPAVFCRASMDGQSVLIPALDELARTVAAAIYEA